MGSNSATLGLNLYNKFVAEQTSLGAVDEKDVINDDRLDSDRLY